MTLVQPDDLKGGGGVRLPQMDVFTAGMIQQRRHPAFNFHVPE
jgi:hypothetical protein